MKGGENMKLKRFGKKSLSQRHLTRHVKQAVELGKAPIIAVVITLADGARVETTGAVIRLLCDAIGEDAAIKWHSKYMEKFDKLTKKSYEELEALVKAAKEKKGTTDDAQTEN